MTNSDDDDLPPGWEERATVDGNIYYVNHVTKSTQWIHPRTRKKKTVPTDLPYGWTKMVDTDGKITYTEKIANIRTHSDPRLAFSKEEKENDHLILKYDGFSTALEVLHGLDLSEKIAIVTGANSGIGFETACSLALHGCRVLFACRSEHDGRNAIAKIRKAKCRLKCKAMQLDLSSLNSVEEFCNKFKKEYEKIDILILNAAILGVPYTFTKDGFESTFQVCHLSHFYLVKLLQDSILSACLPRIVIVSSESHRFSDLSLETLNEKLYSPKKEEYWSLMAYNNAKLCNILFTSELHRRLYHKGVNVYAVHPGNLIRSGLPRHYLAYRILFFVCSFFTKSLTQGASSAVFCSTSPSLNKISGVYWNNCQICEPSEKAKDHKLSSQLWLLSEKLLSKRSVKNNNEADVENEM